MACLLALACPAGIEPVLGPYGVPCMPEHEFCLCCWLRNIRPFAFGLGLRTTGDSAMKCDSRLGLGQTAVISYPLCDEVHKDGLARGIRPSFRQKISLIGAGQ